MNKVMKKAALGINIINNMPDVRSTKLAFDRNGKMEIHFSDAIDLGLDNPLMPRSFVNGGTELSTRNRLWINMFKRFSANVNYVEDENANYAEDE